MPAGRRRNRVMVTPPTPALDEMHQVIPTYNVANATPCWAEITPLLGGELEKAKALSADVTHRVKLLYYAASVNPRTRIEHRGRTLEVVAALNTDERNRELVCMCKEDVS
jgi:SPP1 family predicted phage head-tail adaptor